jgi:putative molybdopterin biosynthesis protein
LFRRLLTLEEAKQVLQEYFKAQPVGIEEVHLLDAVNRVLAEDVIAEIDVPPFDRSTVDGYAVKANDTFGANESKPIKLKVCGAVNVGEKPKITVKHGMAAEIMTGAPIPEGANAVVMAEYTERKNDEVYIYTAVTEGENVMKTGADIKRGEIIVKNGCVLGAREIGAIAAVGKARVKVYKIPRVAILSTGAEITEPVKPLRPGEFFVINAFSLCAAFI